MKSLIKLVLFFIITTSLTACVYDHLVVPVKQNVSFKLDIQPILSQECTACHNPDPDLHEGLAFKSLMSLKEGSIVKGHADDSELMQMLNGGGDNPMPPGSMMSPAKIALIARWIDEGALDN